jgi:hypothetical protein
MDKILKNDTYTDRYSSDLKHLLFHELFFNKYVKNY